MQIKEVENLIQVPHILQQDILESYMSDSNYMGILLNRSKFILFWVIFAFVRNYHHYVTDIRINSKMSVTLQDDN